MKQKCASCQNERFIISKGLCSECLLRSKQGAAPLPINAVDLSTHEQATPKTPTPEMVYHAPAGVRPTNGVSKVSTGKLLVCDGCDKEFKALSPFGKLNLCAECHTKEHNAAAELHTYDPKNYKTWPRCNKCHAHVVREQLDAQDGVCFKCAQSKPTKADSLSIKPTDSNKYQEFFNAETIAITDLLKLEGPEQGILSLRQIIIDTTDALFSQEAQAFQTKTRLQSQKVKYNDLLSTLSTEEQDKLRIEDSKYKPKSGVTERKHKSPMAQIEKKKKLVKSLDEQINSMFGGTLSAAEIEEKKKALGL